MKRALNQIRIEKIWPLIFWENCNNCEMQFRHEKGFLVYSTIMGGLSTPFEIERKYCGYCVADVEAAKTLFEEMLRKREMPAPSNRPAPPPPPPSPRKPSSTSPKLTREQY